VKQQVEAGFPLEKLLNDGDTLLEDMERIATRFRKSFFEHIVNPHIDAGAPGTALPDLAAKVALLRPLSVRLVSILLSRAIERGGGPIAPQSKPAEPKDGTRKPRKPAKARKGKHR
jgi:hypothetical protein